MNNLSQNIEALLFAFGRMQKQDLAKKLNVSPEELQSALLVLATEPRGIVLVDDGRTVELRTSAETSELVERVQKEENSREIGKAGLEALATILYRGPLTRAEIDFIRGVNSSQTLRTLTMRGLVRRVENPRDERSFLYEPTTELLAHLGVASVQQLPDYQVTKEKLSQLEAAYRAELTREAN
jgi:segregation and condensation protein B